MAEEDDKKVSDTEAKAREMGWRPKDEYEGDPDKWVDSGEFVRNAPLYEGLHKANRTVKKLEKTVKALAEHNAAIEKAAYDKALHDLKAEKKQAAAENDVARVVAIEEQIAAVTEAKPAPKAEAATEMQQVFIDWRAENSWYDEDKDMARYANGIGKELEDEHDEKSDEPWSHAKLLAEVAKATKKAFAHKGKNPNREAPGKVGAPKGGEPPAKGSKLPTYNDLPKEAQENYREWVKTDKNKHGFMTGEDFLRQYALKAGLVKEESDNG